MLDPQSFFEAHARHKSKIASRARGIGVRVAHVAFLRAVDDHGRFAARDASDELEHFVNRDA